MLLIFLLIAVLLIVVMLWIVMTRMVARMRRLEDLLGGVAEEKEEPATTKKDLRRIARSEFDQFLEEDGKRRMLKKSEQAAAFREWRRERGLTWNAEKTAESSD
jgi:hypothetical protein